MSKCFAIVPLFLVFFFYSAFAQERQPADSSNDTLEIFSILNKQCRQQKNNLKIVEEDGRKYLILDSLTKIGYIELAAFEPLKNYRPLLWSNVQEVLSATYYLVKESLVIEKGNLNFFPSNDKLKKMTTNSLSISFPPVSTPDTGIYFLVLSVNFRETSGVNRFTFRCMINSSNYLQPAKYEQTNFNKAEYFNNERILFSIKTEEISLKNRYSFEVFNDKNELIKKDTGYIVDMNFPAGDFLSKKYTIKGFVAGKMFKLNDGGIVRSAIWEITLKNHFYSLWYFQVFLSLVFVILLIFASRITIKKINNTHQAELSAQIKQGENERIAREMSQAQSMQIGLLPTILPKSNAFEIEAICIPTLEVGGDFYDIFWLNDDCTKIGIASGDVSGKGMKAAMTVTLAFGVLTHAKNTHVSKPASLLTEMNKSLNEKKPDSRMFTAMSFCTIDFKTKEMALANCGQPEIILYRNGIVSFIETPNPRLPLGIKRGINYNDCETELESGDILIFYSDGIPEAMSTNNDQFGYDKLVEIIESKPDWNCKELSEKIVLAVKEFTGGAMQYDDITLVILRVG